MVEMQVSGDIAGGGMTGKGVEGGPHFFYTDVNGTRVENYQTDLDAIVGNLGGDFKYGVSPQGYVATLLDGDASCHSLEYGGRQVHNTVNGILELRPVKGGDELSATELEYAREGDAYLPIVKATYGDVATGEFFSTTDGIGVARYHGKDVDTVKEPRVFIRNESSPNVYLKQTDAQARTGTVDIDGDSQSYFVEINHMKGDTWGENRAIVTLTYDKDGEHNVLFAMSPYKDADAMASRMIEKVGKIDQELEQAKGQYSKIMKEKGIDVFGTFIDHLEEVVDTYGGIPQRIRIDGKPASTWGEQVDQFAIPLSTIREVGEGIGRAAPDRRTEEHDRLYKVGELLEVMHFFPKHATFSASLPFDATAVPLQSTDGKIRYTASGGYGGMEWPGRDGAHIAGDLARDGWHRFSSKQDLYKESWPLVEKLVGKLEEKMGPNNEVPFSFCPWEHFAGKLSYIGIEVSQGLRNAAHIAEELGYTDKARDWNNKADILKQKTIDQFWNNDQGYFIREEHDGHLDASPNMSAILNGFLDLSKDNERNMAERILSAVDPRSAEFGGILRMEDEYYIGRNPWFVCTGQYVQATEKLAKAEDAAGEKGTAQVYRDVADGFISWMEEHQNDSGTYPEQKMFHQPPRTDDGSNIPPLEGWTLLPWSEVEVRKALIARDE